MLIGIMVISDKDLEKKLEEVGRKWENQVTSSLPSMGSSSVAPA
jgi:hypothetical protein